MMNTIVHYYYSVPSLPDPQIVESDICIYGATSAAITAAVQAASLGHTVTVLAFNRHIGGMTTSGLGATDVGDKHVIGGLARKFYQEIGRWYGSNDEQWFFEPHAAMDIFKRWLTHKNITLFTECRLSGLETIGKKIVQIFTEKGLTCKARVFIDATYEGDLMARAGVNYDVGREGNSVYDELYNGIQYSTHHNFKMFVDPYRKKGDPSSGLLPMISERSIGSQGLGDHLIQAYNFRLCLSYDPRKKIPFSKPENYTVDNYEILNRYINAGMFDLFGLTRKIPNKKADHNNWGAFNSDFIGGNYGWPQGDYETRENIFQQHVNYQVGMFYFCTTCPTLPSIVKDITSRWGLAPDEFTDSGNWPPELYIREARRMISDYVLTENDTTGKSVTEDTIGLGSYRMDSHNCKRVVHAGRVMNEGDIEMSPLSPFPIPYRAITPKRSECQNLLVPVCLSASHIAYGAIRMEPVFLILGQSAALAASLALSKDNIVQDISYSDLEHKLREAGQIISIEDFPKKYRTSSESGGGFTESDFP
jgi:hypothetical protein